MISFWAFFLASILARAAFAFAKDRPAVVLSALITDLRSRFSAGFAAKVEAIGVNDRIWLLLDLPGRETLVSADSRNIIPA